MTICKHFKILFRFAQYRIVGGRSSTTVMGGFAKYTCHTKTSVVFKDVSKML